MEQRARTSVTAWANRTASRKIIEGPKSEAGHRAVAAVIIRDPLLKTFSEVLTDSLAHQNSPIFGDAVSPLYCAARCGRGRSASIQLSPAELDDEDRTLWLVVLDPHVTAVGRYQVVDEIQA